MKRATLFFAVIILLSKIVTSEVIGTNGSACLNTTAVLTCTTVTSSGNLEWLNSVGVVTNYDSQSNVDELPRQVDNFLTKLISITTFGEGIQIISTATTDVPVNISHNGTGLRCTDSIGNVITVSIHIQRISSPSNLICLVSNNCMDTSQCTVTCTWDPPNDTPFCVTEYIIRNELDNAQLSTVQGNINTTSFEVDKYTKNSLVVIAKDLNSFQKFSNKFLLDIFEPKFLESDIKFELLDLVNVTLDMNTTLLISWEYTPNRPPVTEQSIGINGYIHTIPNTDRSAMFNVTRNQAYIVTFMANNTVGTNSTTIPIFITSSIRVTEINGIHPAMYVRDTTLASVVPGGVLLALVICLLLVIIGILCCPLKKNQGVFKNPVNPGGINLHEDISGMSGSKV